MTGVQAGRLPREGDIIAGKYRVERVLGAGGMGVVVAAHHVQLDERVALKFLLPDALVSQEAVGRFVREARAAVKIKNEHVARVSDVGTLENGSPYMVMEYLEGADLAAWLAKRGALPVDQAVDFVLQACEAIAEAHSLGIVHRDLKPANLFCVQKPDGSYSIKVLDFGISKLTTPGVAGHEMTKTTAFLGSPLYMSPEQMQLSKGVDARTDIWSLGVILYELLTGRAPFDADAVTELIIRIATAPAPALRGHRPDAPAGLEPVVARCLEKERAQRFQTVGELAVALQRFGTPRARISVEGIVGTLQRAGIMSFAPEQTRDAGGIAIAATAASLPGPHTDASWGQTASRKASGGKAFAAVVGVATAGMIALGVSFAVHKAPDSTASGGGELPSASSPLAASSAAPVVTAAATVVPSAPSPVASAQPSAAPAETTHAQSIAPRAPKASAPASTKPAAASPSAATPASAAPDCNPRYYYDANGGKHYKPECFGK